MCPTQRPLPKGGAVTGGERSDAGDSHGLGAGTRAGGAPGGGAVAGRGDSDDDSERPEGMPNWETISLPPDHILRHYAHCHPTDLDHPAKTYDEVVLGGMASMATVVEDQGKVMRLVEGRGWGRGDGVEGPGEVKTHGVRVVACFGYHPWFVHRYTLLAPPPTKSAHYLSIFFTPRSSPSSKARLLLDTLLPYLPDPLPFEPLLDRMKRDISSCLARGELTMVGEVGLDGGARVRWPESARGLYVEKHATGKGDDGQGGQSKEKEKKKENEVEDDDDEKDEWKRLTPFKSSMEHQRQILERQLEVAVELGVNVSVHSVAAAGATMDALIAMRDKHGSRFTNRVNVDLHSAGGWSPDFWAQAEKQLNNLYASPSILITGRSPTASALIRRISRDKILVESDTHDATLCSRLVWAATVWIGRCKGWKIEGYPEGQDQDQSVDPWIMDPAVEDLDTPEEDVWAVRTLERNWARFMRLID